ncbi:MAG: hypothetical protein WKF85_11310 [Chitinophagaceae bacterium]
MYLENKIIFKIIALTFLISSCKKLKISCSGNCSDVTISGFVYDKSLNVFIGNQDIEVSINPRGGCLLCLANIIGTGKSNSSGFFSINTKFDTSLSDNKYLLIKATPTDNYFTYPQNFGPGIINNKQNILSQSFSNINTSTLNNLRFNFYSKALLKVNLHRISNTINDYPLFQEFNFDNTTTSVIVLNETATNRDTSLTIYTASNLLTKIKTYQRQSQTTVNTKYDSIFCSSNTINTINIDY